MANINQKDPNLEVLNRKFSDYLTIKRISEVVISTGLLIFFSPLLVFLAFLLFLDDGLPVFFRQVRVGKDGKSFVIWKFRTMPITKKTGQVTTDKRNWVNGVPDDFVFESCNPPGISWLGKSFRKYSLDELPQLINVINGTMSIIGPRPEVHDIANYYNEKQRERLQVKPGITGYAQVNGRSHLNHGEKIYYDRYYVENCSFKLDRRIMVETFKKVIKASDSY